MPPVLWVALVASGELRELATIDPRTFANNLIPATMALGSLLLYFTALRGDWVSRVFPLTELGPLVAFVLAALFLGEPWHAPAARQHHQPRVLAHHRGDSRHRRLHILPSLRCSRLLFPQRRPHITGLNPAPEQHTSS